MRYIILNKSESEKVVFNTKEHGEDIARRVKLDVELHNRDLSESEHWNCIESEVWPPVEIGLDEYKEQACNIVSGMSRAERCAILDDQTILNILTGAVSGYPAYLTPANVAKMIERFKFVSKQAVAEIKASTTKTGIDSVLKKLVYPTAAEIIAEAKKAK